VIARTLTFTRIQTVCIYVIGKQSGCSINTHYGMIKSNYIMTLYLCVGRTRIYIMLMFTMMIYSFYRYHCLLFGELKQSFWIKR